MQRIWQIFRAEGLKGVAERIWYRLYGSFYVVTLELTETFVPTTGTHYTGMHMDLEQMNNETYEQMVQAYPDEISSEQKARLLNRMLRNSAEKVYVMKNGDGQVMGCYCAAYGVHYSSREQMYIQEPGNVYLFDDFTFKDHRNKGAHKASIAARANEALKNGYRSVTAIIASDNTYSLKAYQSCGFTKQPDVIFLRTVRTKPGKPSF